EGQPFDPFAAALVDRFQRGAPPKECAALPADDWVDWQDGALRLHGLGDWVTRVDDPAASDRKAARMRADHNQWATQCPIGDELAGEKWRVCVSLRAAAKAKDGTAFTIGIYDTAGAKAVSQRTVPITELVADGYQTVDLGTHDIKPGYYVWVAPSNNPTEMEAVLVDRMFAIKAKE
ncbi:MAG: hypothetical protein HZB16_17995, partial [Armatimonadetes bacterium]|nr:hypothetical protein [Armatimonadota bacterium]